MEKMDFLSPTWFWSMTLTWPIMAIMLNTHRFNLLQQSKHVAMVQATRTKYKLPINEGQ